MRYEIYFIFIIFSGSFFICCCILYGLLQPAALSRPIAIYLFLSLRCGSLNWSVYGCACACACVTPLTLSISFWSCLYYFSMYVHIFFVSVSWKTMSFMDACLFVLFAYGYLYIGFSIQYTLQCKMHRTQPMPIHRFQLPLPFCHITNSFHWLDIISGEKYRVFLFSFLFF